MRTGEKIGQNSSLTQHSYIQVRGLRGPGKALASSCKLTPRLAALTWRLKLYSPKAAPAAKPKSTATEGNHL
ncbi:hypothetical protein PCANC_04533 [Puccinia coronata f. sp. avenae]|uniref:Uncharacterized protein n=1 Tax=Puccinia coronata f. sp. avenae TaxID=200324 RepID=A0A2N5VW76_9BASI|nr:hypothetical protein PCANC_04533 [Puccinia coronata f. sp. avenae]